jgi:putative transposase
MIGHIWVRGNRKQSVFVDDADRMMFLEVLRGVVAERRWRLLAYCLMGNHYHLIAEIPDGDLTAGMHLLNSTYARRFNHRHEVGGHLFEKRYGSKDLSGEEHLITTIGYVARNPVSAGLCERAGDWRWSSARAALGQAPAPPFLDTARLWSLLGPTDESAQSRLRRIFEDGADGHALRDAIRERLISANRLHGLTVREIAEALGVSTTTVIKLMK